MGRGFEPHGAHVRDLLQLHESGDYLTHEKLWIASLRSREFAYRNGYYLTTPGRWRGLEWEPILDSGEQRGVLVVGHSDLTVSRELVERIMESTNVKLVFASNLHEDAAELPQVNDLPLGIPNDEQHSKTHIVQSDARLLKKAWRRARPPINPGEVMLYANFSIRNNPPERTAAWDALENAPWVLRGKFELSKRGRLQDLIAMRQCGLVVCPPGGGMDTHRFWEALTVGAIPVTTHSDHSARVARSLELPVITVESWQKLRRRDWLLDQWKIVTEQPWDYSPLTSSFWLHKFSSSLRYLT